MDLTRRHWIQLSAAALASASGARASAQSRIGAPFSPNVLRGELTWLRDTMIEVGVKPFAYCDEAQWRAEFDAASASLQTPIDAWQFWLVAGALIASLNDGHAGLSAHDLFVSARRNGLRACPLMLEVRPSGTFVSVQTADAFPAQTRVDGIQGIRGMDLAHAVARLTGGQREILRYDFATSRIAPYLYTQLGEVATYEVQGQTPAGTAARATLAATTNDELLASVKRTQSTPNAFYTFSHIAGGKVGYIDYRSCQDADAFAAFLKTTFSSIAAQPIDGLIIDIRDNGGGDSTLNNDLWGYVTDKPFAQFGGYYEKVSDRLKREYGEAKYVDVYTAEAWAAKDGSVLADRSYQLVHPGPNPLRYHGPVYLLIGTGTFSSALACAVAARDFGLATIVGEETAEPVDTTGEIYVGRSPAVGLSFAFTTKLFLGPKPRPDGQGVLPDVRIVPTEDDIRAGRDPVLAYAVKAITGR